jgi:hypothetical protein
MLKFNLVENALDSLEHAIGHLTVQSLTISEYKKVISDLAHVVELLLKERLRQIHPAFVFSDVDKYPSKLSSTVNPGLALERLKKLGSVEFSEKDCLALKNIREKRNDISHYEFNINENEAKIVIGNTLAFIFRFSCDELGLDWADRRLNDPQWLKLKEHAAFYEAQLAHIKNQLENSDTPTMDCPMCRNDTFDLDAEVCLLCGHREEVLTCKMCKSNYFALEEEYESDIRRCPSCVWEEGYVAANFDKY